MITQPIRELLKQDTQFIWEYEQEAAFEAIKTRLSTAPVLAFFDVQKKVTVSCDASQLAAMRHSWALVQCCYRKDGPLPMYLAHSQALRQDVRK